MNLTFSAMNDSLKKGTGETPRFYTVQGMEGKLGRSRKSIYAAITRLRLKPSGLINGKPAVYTEEDCELIANNLRKPNATADQ